MEEKDIKQFSKILSDNPETKITEFDIVYLIDATGSMSSYISAAKNQAENISKDLRKLYPEMNFQYGYIFYRDPIDSPEDIHEIINLTDNVNSLPEQIGKIKAYGGGDMPEDWVGAYKKVNNEIKWRNGNKVIIHIADAGAHGKKFTLSDKYPEEEKKLIKELDECIKKKIKIFGYVIEEDSRNSFVECKKYYQSKGGAYEIFNFEKPKNLNNYDYESESDSDDIYESYSSDSDGEKKESKKKVKSKKIKDKKYESESDSASDSDGKKKKSKKKVKSKKIKDKEYECDSASDSDYKKRKSKKKAKKKKNKDVEYKKSKELDYQSKIDEELRDLVITSIKSTYKE